MGADPSPTMTIIPVVVFVVAPLAAEIAPASIKLARAPMNAFFTVQTLLQEISLLDQNGLKTPSTNTLCRCILTPPGNHYATD
jgi:hypothetical protein